MKNYTEREALQNWDNLKVGDLINKDNASKGDWNYTATILKTDEPNYDGSIYSIIVALDSGITEKMTFIKKEKVTKHFGTITSLERSYIV